MSPMNDPEKQAVLEAVEKILDRPGPWQLCVAAGAGNGLTMMSAGKSTNTCPVHLFSLLGGMMGLVGALVEDTLRHMHGEFVRGNPFTADTDILVLRQVLENARRNVMEGKGCEVRRFNFIGRSEPHPPTPDDRRVP